MQAHPVQCGLSESAQSRRDERSQGPETNGSQPRFELLWLVGEHSNGRARGGKARDGSCTPQRSP